MTEDRNAPAVAARGIVKRFGPVEALRGVDLEVNAGQVLALLGDNGAGKSTLIKILSGVLLPDEGEIRLFGESVRLSSPRQARARGIATVYQDLGIVDLMSISRNFFLGAEPERKIGPFAFLDMAEADRVTRRALLDIGIKVRNTAEPAAILSGGERQSISIARAVHFGAKVLILDEPTSALGAREAAKVLTYIDAARARSLAVILISHNLHHVLPVADRFTVLQRGRVMATLERNEVTDQELDDLVTRAEAPEELLFTARTRLSS